jgi:hypothetical protein
MESSFRSRQQQYSAEKLMEKRASWKLKETEKMMNGIGLRVIFKFSF